MADVPLNDLLRCGIQVIGRLAFKPKDIGDIVAANAKLFKAYNLCDGTKSQSEVAKAAGLDHGNFSRTAARWVQAGVLFKTGEANDAKLLHLYPLGKDDVNLSKTKRNPRKSGKRKRAKPRR